MNREKSKGKIIPPKIPKYTNYRQEQNPLFQEFKKTMQTQQRKFRLMNMHCDELQRSVSMLQGIVQQFNKRIQQFLQNKGIQQMQSLKDKQNSFIIQQLNLKIKKLQRRQAEISEQYNKSKLEIIRLQSIIDKDKQFKQLESKQIQLLNTQVKAKNSLVSQLNKQISIIKRTPSETLPSKLNQKQYIQLSNKLKQIESLMSLQIQELKSKNNLLSSQIKRLEQEKQKNQARINTNIYQLEIKLKQHKKIHKELQEAHNMLLAKSSENQINLHQQIMLLKKNLNDEKKNHKTIKKQYSSGFNQLIKTLLDKNYTLKTTKISQQFYQVSRQVIKANKRNFDTIKQQNIDKLEKLETEIQAKVKQIGILESQKQKLQKSIYSSVSSVPSQLVNQNSSFNKSTSDTNEQRYKIKLQSLKKQLKNKQNRIYEMQQQMDQQFNQTTEKLLKIEQQFLVKNNECRRKEQIIQEKNMQIKQLKKKMDMNQNLKDDLKTQYTNNKNMIEDSFKEKISRLEATLQSNKQNLKQTQSRQQQLTSKMNKLKAKVQRNQIQFTQNMKVKTQKIDELNKKNQHLLIQIKLAQQKVNMQSQMNGDSTPHTPYNKDLIEQIQMERDRILQQYEVKAQQYTNLEIQKKLFGKKIKSLEQDLQEEKQNNQKYKTKYQNIKKQFQTVKSDLKNKLDIAQKEHKTAFIQLRKQYQKVSNGLNTVEKNLEKKRKDYEQGLKSRDKYKTQAISLKTQYQKINNKNKQLESILKDRQNEKTSIIKEYKLKISQQDVKVEELLKIINYRNNNPDDSLRESIRNTEHNNNNQQSVVKLLVQTQQIGINTDKINMHENSIKQQQCSPKKSTTQKPFVENLFLDLQTHELNDDNFQICDEQEELNFGKAQENIRIKQIFNKLRLQIQKVLNGQEASFSILKLLPQQLQDDYNQFISYIRQKIFQLKNCNDISFINVVIGNQPDCSETSLDLPDLMNRNSQQVYKKMLQQKQYLIQSMMAQRTQQQNTINQLTVEKQQIQQQNENRFMNQCNIYKKQIKQHKKTIDILEMNFQSIKNLLKNVCEIWVTEDDMEEDLRDNMELYAKVAKLTEKQRSRLNYYIAKYRQIKKIQ